MIQPEPHQSSKGTPLVITPYTPPAPDVQELDLEPLIESLKTARARYIADNPKNESASLMESYKVGQGLEVYQKELEAIAPAMGLLGEKRSRHATKRIMASTSPRDRKLFFMVNRGLAAFLSGVNAMASVGLAAMLWETGNALAVELSVKQAITRQSFSPEWIFDKELGRALLGLAVIGPLALWAVRTSFSEAKAFRT
ncbi:MAG: hypothetical protein KDD62_14075, partial [Bdellovibrionales bacterium]|nr:hypothetical protein [Bdellovibrionales bacterium]